jgi:hypothetical protein
MHARTYDVLHRAVEEGVMYGIRRLWKHRDTLTEDDTEVYAEEVTQAVMNAVCEMFDFDDLHEDE